MPVTKNMTLWVHDDKFSKSDIIVNPDLLNVNVGQILQINHTNSSKKLVIQITKESVESIKSANLQISIAQNLATLFELKSRTDVVVSKINPESVVCDYVEYTFRDQYITRSHMWFL